MNKIWLYIGDTDAGDRMKIDFTYFYPIYGAENSFIYLLAAVLFLLVVALPSFF